MKRTLFTLLTMSVFFTSACSSTGSSTRVREIRIDYAKVTAVTRVTTPSAAPAGAILGGFTGLILSGNQRTSRRIASGVGGAVLGGLATSALEGDRRAYQYSLQYPDRSVSRFVTEKGYLRVGDCVSVEQGEYSNIRRVATVLCNGTTTNPTPVDPVHVRDAQQCHEAKEQLLAAETPEDVDSAARKVQVICQY